MGEALVLIKKKRKKKTNEGTYRNRYQLDEFKVRKDSYELKHKASRCAAEANTMGIFKW